MVIIQNASCVILLMTLESDPVLPGILNEKFHLLLEAVLAKPVQLAFPQCGRRDFRLGNGRPVSRGKGWLEQN